MTQLTSVQFGVHQTRVLLVFFISGIAQGHRSALGKCIQPPAPSLFQRRFNTGEVVRKTALLSIKKKFKKLYQMLFFLEVYLPLKPCYYNTKLDLGFSKESRVISWPIPTRLPRELDPKCLWLFWKTSSITEIHRLLHQKVQESKVWVKSLRIIFTAPSRALQSMLHWQ